MLIPRFSISWILGLTSVCGLFFYVVSLGMNGSRVALAASLTVTLVLLCFAIYAVAFLVAYFLASLTRRIKPAQKPQNPFASSAELPPQYVPETGLDTAE